MLNWVMFASLAAVSLVCFYERHCQRWRCWRHTTGFTTTSGSTSLYTNADTIPTEFSKHETVTSLFTQASYAFKSQAMTLSMERDGKRMIPDGPVGGSHSSAWAPQLRNCLHPRPEAAGRTAGLVPWSGKSRPSTGTLGRLDQAFSGPHC